MHKPILIVSECYPAGDGEIVEIPAVLKGLMHQAGLSSADCHSTVVVPEKGPPDRFLGPKAQAGKWIKPVAQGKYLKEQYAAEVDRLHREIHEYQPNVILIMGNLALWAITAENSLKRNRGAPMLSRPIHGREYKVIATWPVASIIRQWELRVVALSDMMKCQKEAQYPEIRRAKRTIYLEPSLEDMDWFYDAHLMHSDFVSCDIETSTGTITEIGFSTADGLHAMVVPFYSRLTEDNNYWPTFAEERRAWKWVRKVCTSHAIIGQNFQYDMGYLWRTVGIPCPFFDGDTMILHHALQPELEKGLGFLGSIYTSEPSWKFMRENRQTLKKETT